MAPVGPAIPVVERPMSVPEVARTPAAIASATAVFSFGLFEPVPSVDLVKTK